MKIGVDTLPTIPKDATDRNRTSPFAFTGNKFEFRAPGSSVCCSGPMTILNTIVAEAVDRIATELGKELKARGFKPLSPTQSQPTAPQKHTALFHSTLQKILQASIKAHKRVVFNGNGYESEWPKEAQRRGLPNAPDTPTALEALAKPENVELMEKYGVMTRRELESRREIFLEEYEKKIRIEAACACDIARTMILPAVRSEYAEVLRTYNETDASNVKMALDMLHEQVAALGNGLVELEGAIDRLRGSIAAGDARDAVCRMADLRKIADGLEQIVDNSRWPLPKYRDMLFLY
jgi:glutamine synthetase